MRNGLSFGFVSLSLSKTQDKPASKSHRGNAAGILKQQKPPVKWTALNSLKRNGLFVCQKILHLVFVNDLLFEGISTGFGAAHGADNLAPVFCFSGGFLVFYLRVL